MATLLFPPLLGRMLWIGLRMITVSMDKLKPPGQWIPSYVSKLMNITEAQIAIRNVMRQGLSPEAAQFRVDAILARYRAKK